MSDYISREAALKRLCKDVCNVSDCQCDEIRCEEWFVIHDIPAADVQEVKRGKWEQVTQPCGWRDYECAECSVCGEDFVLDEWGMDDFTNLMNFCPNCGADMRPEPPKEVE